MVRIGFDLSANSRDRKIHGSRDDIAVEISPDRPEELVPVHDDVAPIGQPGVVQVVSTLPRSHPGHLLLTEDLGVVDGIDDGYWPGKRFTVLGRLPTVAARGCSDTFGGSGG